MAVSARYVSLHPDARLQKDTSKSVAGIGHNFPSADVAISESSELLHEFKLVIPGAAFSEKPCANRVAEFIGHAWVS
jgi:hypothetical protein